MSLHSGGPGLGASRSADASRGGSADAATRILNETINVINRSGEASVRLTQVARRAGVTQGLISYHFGDRDALVAAAQLQRFLDCDEEILEQLRARRTTTPHPHETRDLLIALVRRPFESNDDLHRRRVSALGAALYRPALASGLAEHQASLLDSLCELVEEGQHLGVVRSALDPRAVASLITMIWYGAITNELVATVDPELDGSVISLIESLIFEP